MKEYVRRRKLSKAAFDVVDIKHSITELAFEHGFESHEAFTRTFKLAYGAPPSSFRKAHIHTLLGMMGISAWNLMPVLVSKPLPIKLAAISSS